MAKLTLVFFALVLTVLGANAWFFSGSGRRSSGRRSHDIGTRSGLTRLYNQRVTKIERVERPMGVPFNTFKHQGVRVTTQNGGQWLIHKGSGYGNKGGETVVTNAKHMSDKWSTVRSSKQSGGVSVGDLVKRGGPGYNIAVDNCYHGATRMENPKLRKRRCA